MPPPHPKCKKNSETPGNALEFGVKLNTVSTMLNVRTVARAGFSYCKLLEHVFPTYHDFYPVGDREELYSQISV
jgi:hypothetical protein